jgi:hypothetical protein
MKNIEIKFPMLSNEKNFLERTSFINDKNRLFISGGYSDLTKKNSNQFLYYEDGFENIRILPELNEARCNHSMIVHEDILYILGGLNTNTIEVFDIENFKLESRINEGFEEVENPILFIKNNWLYSFFGKKSGKNINFVQRVNLKAKNFKWEKFFYKLEDNDLDLNFTNAACIPFGNDEVLFLGGKFENEALSKNVICFNFETKCFKNTKIKMNSAYNFNNSSFVKFNNGVFVAFADNEKEALIRINLDLL